MSSSPPPSSSSNRARLVVVLGFRVREFGVAIERKRGLGEPVVTERFRFIVSLVVLAGNSELVTGNGA